MLQMLSSDEESTNGASPTISRRRPWRNRTRHRRRAAQGRLITRKRKHTASTRLVNRNEPVENMRLSLLMILRSIRLQSFSLCGAHRKTLHLSVTYRLLRTLSSLNSGNE